MALVAVCLLIERGLNVLVPMQMGRVTDALMLGGVGKAIKRLHHSRQFLIFKQLMCLGWRYPGLFASVGWVLVLVYLLCNVIYGYQSTNIPIVASLRLHIIMLCLSLPIFMQARTLEKFTVQSNKGDP